MSALYVLWLLMLRRFVRSKAQIIAAIGQPVIYLLAMGFGLEDVFRQAGRGSYLQFVAPGILAMTVLFAATYIGISVLWDRQMGFLKVTLVAPVPRILIMLGRTFGAATVAILQGVIVAVVCAIAGFRPVSLAQLPASLGFLVLIALAFAGIGTLIGASMKNMQGTNAIVGFVVTPLFFLSGAYYPLDNLPSVLAFLTWLNPLSYGVDGLRATLIAQSHFDVALDAIVLIALTVVVISVGAWRFSKVEA
jgi:ABC-2 type transport system permease protein